MCDIFLAMIGVFIVLSDTAMNVVTASLLGGYTPKPNRCVTGYALLRALAVRHLIHHRYYGCQTHVHLSMYIGARAHSRTLTHKRAHACFDPCSHVSECVGILEN